MHNSWTETTKEAKTSQRSPRSHHRRKAPTGPTILVEVAPLAALGDLTGVFFPFQEA